MDTAVTFIPDAAPGALAGPLPVLDVGVAAIATCLAAAAGLAEARSGHRPAVSLRHASVVAALTSSRLLRIDGEPLSGDWAPLSRFWPTADGWVRTHGNYPWHRAALLEALGVTTDDDVAGAIAALTALDVQERVVAAGGVAAALNNEAQWRAGPVARAVDARELIEIEAIGDAPRGAPGLGRDDAGQPALPGPLAAGELPCSGLKVLDLTRVIAGPVATRMLAALGADVLRIDPPSHPEGPGNIADMLVGKRSAVLDARTTAGRATLVALAHEADVIVTGYRPGSLDLLGFAPEAIAYRHPGTVLVTLSAWGVTGPWGRRRGFDSLVQAASGIAERCAGDDGTPGTLPCQLLDHATGYLAAAGALRALTRQRLDGGTHGVWVSLARTAAWLLDQPVDVPPPGVPGSGVELADLQGLQVVPPPGSLDGVALRWPGNRPVYGGAAPAWGSP